MKCELTVAAALDFKLLDDVDSRCTEHRVLSVAESYGRCDNDTVACVNAYRIEVLHGAHRDNVALCVTDNFKLYFLPAAYALLNKYLCDR